MFSQTELCRRAKFYFPYRLLQSHVDHKDENSGKNRPPGRATCTCHTQRRPKHVTWSCASSLLHYIHDSHSSGCGGSPVSTCPPRSVTHCHRQQRRGDGGGRCRSAAAAAARSVWPLPSHLGRCAGVFPIKLIAPTSLPASLPNLTLHRFSPSIPLQRK